MKEKFKQLDAVIVGAGFAGLYLVKALTDRGFSVCAFESGGGVGGTWYWNRYPGARCDLESFDYSYSFSKELLDEWSWTERYPSQSEILRYLNFVADRFSLRQHIQLNITVTKAAFDESANAWSVYTSDGAITRAKFCIMATGVLSVPKPPEIPGIERFKGQQFHTGQWPHDAVDFTGQRVAIIGTGSSAVQCAPIIADQASQLTVFQRTPNYTVPAINYPLDSSTVEGFKLGAAKRREIARASRFGIPAEFPTLSALCVSPEERWQTYERAWKNSHLLAFRLTYGDILTSEDANATVSAFLHEKIRTIVKDPATAEALLPRSYPFGTKRPCLGSGYYPMFNRDNVRLIDLRRSPIAQITEDGIETTEEAIPFDSIIFATGFDALTGAVARIDVRGRRGATLKEMWRDGPRAYLGLAVHGFPNMFLMTGPGSPGPLSNMVVSIEQHVEWICDCLAFTRDRKIHVIEPSLEAQDAWVEHSQDVVSQTLYMHANSWYLGANVPGKPRVFMPYLGGVGVYRSKCTEVAQAGYVGFELVDASGKRTAQAPEKSIFERPQVAMNQPVP